MKLLRVFLVVLSLSVSHFTFARDYEGLVIFGDSLSDTGNLASVTTNFPFPFFENRISNGPVLVDFLALELGTTASASRHARTSNGGNNFAIAGGNIVGNDTEDLSSQVDAYLTRENNLADPKALYFVMIGGNDLRDIRSIKSSVLAAQRVSQTADALLVQLSRLYDAGARSFYIANVANIGRIPETLSREPSDPGISARAETYVRQYNQILNTKLNNLFAARPGVVQIFDLFSELELILSSASNLGFTQTNLGCFMIDGFRFLPDCRFGSRFDRFVFFDNIHPTSKTNQLVSNALARGIPARRNNRDIVVAAIVSLLLQ